MRRRAPDIATSLNSLVNSLNNLALVLRAQGRLSEAEPLAREALEMRRRALPAGHPDIATSLNNLAVLLEAQGKVNEAEPLAREALEIRRRALPAGHPDIAQSLNSLAVVLQAQGKLSEAEPLFREALQLSRQALPAGHPDIAPSLTGLRSLAFACYLKEDYRGAERVLRGLLEEGFEIPSTHCHLARVLLLMDRAAEARQHVALAWNQISDAPPSIVPRIVFFQLLFALQDGSRTEAGDDEQGPARQIGRLKTALQSENSHAEWNIQAMLDHLAVTRRAEPRAPSRDCAGPRRPKSPPSSRSLPILV